MTHKNITQTDLDNLIEDARYLQDEIEALQYVIEEIPYKQEHPSEKSIAELLYWIDHTQKYYYKPIVEKAIKVKEPIVDARRLASYEDSFNFDAAKVDDIQKKLQKIVKHRAALVNAMEKVHLIDWDQPVRTENSETELFTLMSRMVQRERNILKKIADRVLVLSKEKQQKRSMRGPKSEE